MESAHALVAFAHRACTSWQTATALVPLVLLGEFILSLLIIEFVRYTPIDFKAYMEEVEGPLVHGVYNYSLLRGETGPLVYPGGFVYLYGAIRWLTDDGANVRPAQYAMAICYIATLGACLACHATARPRRVPPYALLLTSLSLRLHSIYVLRLFNDGWAMLGFWLACLAFVRGQWKIGCVCYSLGVSVKANVLLSAPGLLLLLLQAWGVAGAVGHIALCAVVQLALGWPFLRADPIAYITSALGGFGDLQQKWSVNWKVLPAWLFYHKAFPLVLLGGHLLCLGLLTCYVWTAKQGGLARALSQPPRRALHPEHVLVTLLGCNCVGVLFARSLHFQFYCWYLHGVPLLLWRCERLPLAARFLTFVLLEYAFSYGLDKSEGTSTPASSLSLQIAHAALLYALFKADAPPTYAEGPPASGPIGDDRKRD